MLTVILGVERFQPRRCRGIEGDRRAWPATGEDRGSIARRHPSARRPVADRPNWTIARLKAENEVREGVKISRSQLSKAIQKNFRWWRPRHTLKGRQIADEVERVGLRLQLRKAQAEAGDIVLLYGDESEALTNPYLARAWARRGVDLRVPAPGQAKKVARDCQEFCARGHDDGKERTITWLSRKNFWTSCLPGATRMRCSPGTGCSTT
ncbi:hypothetical protein ACWGTO_27660 [Mesorhizobium sp. PL10]